MEIIDWFVTHLNNVISTLRRFQFLGVDLWILLLSFLVVSMVISIFWRGARG